MSKLLPFLSWIGELRHPATLRADLLAGLTVALVLIPQSMAYAQLAGLPAYYGLYAAFLPPIVSALFGSSRQLANGPVAVVSLMTAAALEPLASTGSEGYIAYAILLALLVGLFQITLGLLRLGVLVNFLSHPVVLGFTNAAAIIIASSQLGKILGVSVDKAEHHYETVWNTLLAGLSDGHLPTLAMATLAFCIMIGLRKFNPRLPGVLIAVVITTAVSWLWGYEQRRQVSPEHIANPEVQLLVQEQFQLRKEIGIFQKRKLMTEHDYRVALEKFGEDSPKTLSALHARDISASTLQQKLQQHQDDLKELRNLHFELVPAADNNETKLYLRDNVPAGLETLGGIWRLRNIIDERELLVTSGGAVVGHVPGGLPDFRAPLFDWNAITQLLSAALTIALIGFMEAIAIARNMATRTRQRLDANQELVGQGMANIVGSLFQSYAVAGSFSRSAVNIGAGARTGFSSVVTGLVVVVALLWLTPLLYHLPQATLAAVIMVAVMGLVRIEPVRHAWKAHKHDGFVAIITFLLTLLLAPHLDKGILIGVGLSLGLYLYRTMKPRVAVLSRYRDGSLRDITVHKLKTCDNISVIRFDGSLYFANTGYFEDKILEKVSLYPDLKFVIVDAGGINQIDATGEEMLVELSKRLSESGIELLIARMKRQFMDTLRRTGDIDCLGEERFFARVQNALDYAWEKLGNDHAASCPLRTYVSTEQSG
ncbi:SulP family inorganic anion transporter [Thiogranum longum]|uniref:SulP family inorganic anion transporter n=1 Tax=Thiogranum longum TaxID=1537524 RepID=UPI00104C64A8|nr:SulP family inorganic anion transporter [Thiogranum longum]